ncbi:MAG: phosphatase PAP2 family protein [Cytophagales bacterium]|nr:phosphatase PAP2 family protein [Cytophagales bacterium]
MLLSAIVLPAVFLSNHHTRKDIGPLLVITYEILAINYGITNSIKSIVNRNRPYVYNAELSYEERTDAQSRYSFFSGHTSGAASFSFRFAKVINDYHPNMSTGAKIGLWSFAALVPADNRLSAGWEARKHYPTDVISGYVIGASIGLLVPHLHKKRNANFSIYPTRLFNQQAVSFKWNF